MIVDIIAGTIFFLSMIVSFFRGIVREILTIAGLVCGIVGALMVGPILEPSIVNWLVADPENPEKIFGVLPPETFASILAYGASFFVITLAISFITYLITKSLQASGLGPINRLLGLVFGAVRGALLIGLLYLPFYYSESDEGYSWMAEAYSAKYIRGSSSLIDRHIIDKYLPEDVEEDIKEEAEELDKELGETKENPSEFTSDGEIETQELP